MKFIGIALFCLFFVTVWSENEEEGAEFADAQAVPIALPIYDYEDGNYGIVVSRKVNWYQAELICRSQGASLVNINDYTELEDVTNMFINNLADYWDVLTRTPPWTSGTNQGGSYKWYGTGKDINMQNFVGTPPTATRCVGLNIMTTYFSTHDCKDTRGFICEKLTASC